MQQNHKLIENFVGFCIHEEDCKDKEALYSSLKKDGVKFLNFDMIDWQSIDKLPETDGSYLVWVKNSLPTPDTFLKATFVEKMELFYNEADDCILCNILAWAEVNSPSFITKI